MGDTENSYVRALKRLKRSFWLVGLFSALVNILMLTGPMFMLQVYDRVLSSGSVPTLQGLFLIVVVLFAFLGFYDFLRVRLLSRGAYRLDQEVGAAAYDIWMRSGLGHAALPSRPLNDLAVLRGFLSSPAMLGMFDTPWIPFYLLVVFLVHPWLGFLTLGGLCIVVFVALLNQLTTHKAYEKAMSMDGAESFFVEQTRRNAESIVPQGMAARLQARWNEMHRRGLGTGQVGGDRAEGFTAGAKAFRMLLQSALLGLGGYLALQQEISAGMIVATSIIAGRALAPVDQVIGQWRAILRAREANRRLHAVFAAEERRQFPKADLPAPEGYLTVAGLTKFAPGAVLEERVPILDHVSFQLEPGDAVGVIGPSASGKSTLARLLVGAWKPDAGEVRLDGATLEQWPDAALGRHIGYLPQHLELLAGTIRDNIARFDPDAEDEKVIEAAKIAGVHEMILQLPQGYMTELGYGLQPLSGGQMQRLGLARALYGTPRYVILDEPNSNLDASGDEALGRAILHLRAKGSTVIVMAHRPSAIAAVNKVLVLHGGRVGEFGDKEDVLQKATRSKRPVPDAVETGEA
ncbi:MAG: type I secretion system permease/ATPase [Rhodobacterales bacterium]|nr:MAG: type I secretion system permease/ATPase [Rhodobacterales bacterium]